MAISININPNEQFFVRGKYGSAPLAFSTTDHIKTTGVKAKYRLTFASENERDNYYNGIINDPFIFTAYDVEIETVTDTITVTTQNQTETTEIVTTYHINIEAKKAGVGYNISFPDSHFPSGNFTVAVIRLGVDYEYKTDYQLYIIAENPNGVLFTKLYTPVISEQTGTATWQIDLSENLAPMLHTPIPELGLTTLTELEEPIELIKIRFGEAYIDEAVNDGKLFYYPASTINFEVLNVKPTAGQNIDSAYFADDNFNFLNIWDRTRYFPLDCNATHFLYFFLKNDAVSLGIQTNVLFKDGTSSIFNQSWGDVNKGIQYFPCGPSNHPSLATLSNINSYTVKVSYSYLDKFSNTLSVDSETFKFIVTDTKCAYEVFFLNQLGAFERIAFDDLHKEQINLSRTKYIATPSKFDTQKGGIAISDIDSESEFLGINQTTLFNTTEMRTWLKDFLTSTEKYLLRNGLFYRIHSNKQEFNIQQLDNQIIVEFPFLTNHPI